MWPILGSELSVVAFFNKISVISFRKVGIYFETKKSVFVQQDRTDLQEIFCTGRMDEWMNGVLGHFYALSRLNWAGDNLG